MSEREDAALSGRAEAAERALEHVRQQARIWHDEATTQKATVDAVGAVLGGAPDYGPIVAVVASLQARLEAAERLARYGALVLNEHRSNGPCDVDGGTLQDLAVQAGAIEPRQVTEPCGENCECACVTDFPTECYFLAPGVRAAIDAATQEQPAAPREAPAAQCHQVSGGVLCGLPRPNGERQCPDCNPCWMVTAPDGRQWLGKSPFQAASAARLATRSPDQLRAIEERLQTERDAADAQMLAEHEHLNCPACGGSGHVDDARDGWISVADRLPEKNIEVLIAFRDVLLPATGQYTASPHDTWGWCFPSENDPEDTGPITHWRPLPAAPRAPEPQA